MAIHLILYACIECGRESSIKPIKGERAEVCERCGTLYTREEGAMIKCAPPNREPETRHPSEWLDILEQHPLRGGARKERALVSFARKQLPYRHSGMYLGHVEKFEPPLPGTIELTEEAVLFRADGSDQTEVWPLDELTAVQPSSTTLQLKIRHGPVVSMKFIDASPLLWEQRLRDAVQRRFLVAGKGEILEFQPRIICG